MSVTEPIFGTDISNHNPNLTLIPKMAELDYKFCFVLAGQGAWFKNQLYNRQQRQLATHGILRGAYYFLDGNASGRSQANHFLDLVGDIENVMLALDFERYSPPPNNTILRDAIRELRNHTQKTLVIYSGPGFWNEPPASGPLSNFDGNLIAWNASYAEDNTGFGENHQRFAKQYYESIRQWQWNQSFASYKSTWFQQFGQGYIDNSWVDVNAARVSMDKLKRLA